MLLNVVVFLSRSEEEERIYRAGNGPEAINWDVLIKETQATNLR
jgi:hypothetical protein